MSREQARIFELESALKEAQAENRELLQKMQQLKKVAQAARECVRTAVDEEIHYMTTQGVYSAAEVDALKRALPLIDPKEADNARN